MKLYFTDDVFQEQLLNNILTFNQLVEYIHNIIEYLELQNHLVDVQESDDDLFAAYNFKDKVIKINMHNIMMDSLMIQKYAKEPYNINLLTNLELLFNIFHELTHIIQKDTIDENKYSIAELYRTNFDTIANISNELYDKYYSCFITEREANMVANENVLSILETYYKNEFGLLKYYYETAKNQLLIGYRYNNGLFQSPMERYYNDLLNTNAPSLDGLSTYDKLKLGTKISKSTFYDNRNKTDELIKKELKKNFS